MKFRFGNREFEPDIRYLADMKDVLYDLEWLNSVEKPDQVELYYMYRGLSLNDDDLVVMGQEKLRYDVTVIPPMCLGKEFVKTKGHCHPLVPGTSMSYTELYEVVKGQAHYLLQKEDDVVLVKAQEGDKVVIPPGYCHITINPLGEKLVMANWVSSAFPSNYGPIRNKKGGAYFELSDGTFIGNKNYWDLPPLREKTPRELDISNINRFKDMYEIIGEEPEKLRFLNEPQQYY